MNGTVHQMTPLCSRHKVYGYNPSQGFVATQNLMPSKPGAGLQPPTTRSPLSLFLHFAILTTSWVPWTSLIINRTWAMFWLGYRENKFTQVNDFKQGKRRWRDDWGALQKSLLFTSNMLGLHSWAACKTVWPCIQYAERLIGAAMKAGA